MAEVVGQMQSKALELNEPLVRLIKNGMLDTNGLRLLHLPLTILGINEPFVVY